MSDVLAAAARADAPLARVLAFSRRFGRETTALAMHAALPLGLSPELVHLLRVNFVPRAPFIAEADLLLSPLCAEVGGGMYEMDADVRELLLAEMGRTPGYGPAHVRRVAGFLHLWATRALLETADADATEHLRVQQWVALAYVDPGGAAEALAGALRRGVEDGDRPEVARVARLTTVLSAPLAAQVELRRFAGAVERVATGAAAGPSAAREVSVGRARLPSLDRVVRLWHPAPPHQPEHAQGVADADEPPIHPYPDDDPRVRGPFDVFLAYNDDDRDRVEDIARGLYGRGITPWFDAWAVRPGESAVDKRNEQMELTPCAIVFLGSEGSGFLTSLFGLFGEILLMAKLRERQGSLIPVVISTDAKVPSHLQDLHPLHYHALEDPLGAIVEAIRSPGARIVTEPTPAAPEISPDAPQQQANVAEEPPIQQQSPVTEAPPIQQQASGAADRWYRVARVLVLGPDPALAASVIHDLGGAPLRQEQREGARWWEWTAWSDAGGEGRHDIIFHAPERDGGALPIAKEEAAAILVLVTDDLDSESLERWIATARVLGPDRPAMVVVDSGTRGSPDLLPVHALTEKYGVRGLVGISSRTGFGMTELREHLHRLVPWEQMPPSSVKGVDWLQRVMNRRLGQLLVAEYGETVRRELVGEFNMTRDPDGELDRAMKCLAARDVVRVIGDPPWALVRGEAYVRCLGEVWRTVRNQREHPDLPYLRIESLRKHFTRPDLDPYLDADPTPGVLDLVVEDLVRRRWAFQIDTRHGQMLVIPWHFLVGSGSRAEPAVEPRPVLRATWPGPSAQDVLVLMLVHFADLGEVTVVSQERGYAVLPSDGMVRVSGFVTQGVAQLTLAVTPGLEQEDAVRQLFRTFVTRYVAPGTETLFTEIDVSPLEEEAASRSAQFGYAPGHEAAAPASPAWPERPAGVDPAQACLVMLPSGTKHVGARVVDFDAVWEHLFRPAIADTWLPEGSSLVAVRVAEFPAPGTPLPDWMKAARLVAVDLTGTDPARVKELGLLPGARTQLVVLFQETSDPPVGLADEQVHGYVYGTPDELAGQRDLLSRLLADALGNPDDGTGGEEEQEDEPIEHAENRGESSLSEQLGAYLIQERDARDLSLNPQYGNFDFLGYHTSATAAEFVAFCDADGLTERDIVQKRDEFFELVLRLPHELGIRLRGRNPNGLLGFVFARGCPEHMARFIARQSRISHAAGTGGLIVSWAIDIPSERIRTHDNPVSIHPPVIVSARTLFPGLDYLDALLPRLRAATITDRGPVKSDGEPPRVFVSSTWGEMVEYRRIVTEACSRAEMQVLDMEAFPARPITVIDVVREAVDRADVYVGIIGHRYGYIMGDMDISVVEMEYDRAVERGIPMLIFMPREGAQFAEHEPPETAAKLERFRERVLRSGAVQFFDSEEDLRAQALRAILALRQRIVAA